MSTDKPMPEGTMSIDQASEVLKLGPQGIRAAIKRGEIQAKKFGKRWYLSRASVEGLLKMDGRAA